MDLKYLRSRHQHALMQMERAASPEARYAHRGIAAGYARSIHDLEELVVPLTSPILTSADDRR